MSEINMRQFNRMGKGWFILCLAKENGIDIGTSIDNYKPKALKTRYSTFKVTKPLHNEMLDYVINNCNSKIRAGSPVLDSKQILKIALEIKESGVR